MDNRKDKSISVNEVSSSKNLVLLRLFEKDNFFLFVYKKTEKIVSALYLASSLFSDSEPVKWRFREVGVDIVSHVLSLTANPLSKADVVSRVNSDLLKLLSLLNISLSAGFISEMNFLILKQELEALLETLIFKACPREGNGGVEAGFDKEFFALPHSLFFSNSRDDFNDRGPSGRVQGEQSSKVPLYDWSDVSRIEDSYKRQSKGHQKDSGFLSQPPSTQKDSVQRQERMVNSTTSPATFTTSRQLAIIKLLKGKNNLTIKDFSLIIKGCSEKTIQRELLRLVKLGVLKKAGERRWSRYSLSDAIPLDL